MGIDARRDIAVRFDHVGFSYGSIRVLENANFHIHAGEFAALVGANGTGKTTVLKLLLGLITPDSGRIEVLGRPPRDAQKSLGYVPQMASHDPAFPISVREVVRIGRLRGTGRRFGPADEEAVERAMQRADVMDLAARSYTALSGGQRRRVLVARALAAESTLLVLDEPTANMDAESEKRLFDTLGGIKGKATVLVVTHDAGFVSALTDAVLCVGERGAGSLGVVRHAAAPEPHAPTDMYGGAVLKVLHDTELPEDECCRERGE